MRGLFFLAALTLACSSDGASGGVAADSGDDDAGGATTGGASGADGSTTGGAPGGGTAGAQSGGGTSSGGAGAGGSGGLGAVGGTGGAGGSGATSGAGGGSGAVPGTPIPNCVPWQACLCVWPNPAIQCNTKACPTPTNPPGGTKCCYTEAGPCGLDFGSGCVPCAKPY